MSDQHILDLLHDTAGPKVPVDTFVADPFQRIPHTASAGPATSQDAGDQHTDSGKRRTNAERVLWLVHRFQPSPASLLARRSMLTLTEVRRRLTDLQALGFVEKGERKGREFTWKITHTGLMKLETLRRAGR